MKWQTLQIESNQFLRYMKYTLVILLLVKTALLFGQNNSITCDSIKLKDGQFIQGEIINKSNRKITYVMCCEDCSVPRKIKRKNIETIFYAERETKSDEINRRDSIPFLQFHKEGVLNTRKKRIKENKIIVVKTLDSSAYKGKVHIVNEQTIRINSDTVTISDIRVVKKPILATKIIGSTIGSFFFGVGVSLIAQFPGGEGFGYSLIADAFALPFFGMNFMKKRFNVHKKWEMEVKFQRIE